MNPNPDPNPNLNPPLSSTSDQYYSYYLQNPSQFSHPHVFADPSAAELRPPGVDTYPQSVTSLPQQQALAVSYTRVDASSSGYYFDPNLQAWVATEFVSDAAGHAAAVPASIPQNGTQHLAIAQQGPTAWTNFTFHVQGNDTLKKLRKKTKVVQSAYCEVCKVDCNSQEILEQHKLGKKHKKNVEKLHGASTSTGTQNPVVGPQPNNVGFTARGLRNKKKAASALEDIETKKRKIVEGGVAQAAVRVCAICNVVCNSDVVFNLHLTGRKHATMLKKNGVIKIGAT